jgi:hypothetical protein
MSLGRFLISLQNSLVSGMQIMRKKTFLCNQMHDEKEFFEKRICLMEKVGLARWAHQFRSIQSE